MITANGMSGRHVMAKSIKQAKSSGAKDPGTMRAAVLRKIRDPLVIEQVPRPTPGPGDVLIAVTACGVCHSDVHAIDGDWSPLPTLPLIPGHEVTGHVAALGAGVTKYAIGNAVGVPWLFSACGACEMCLSGMETICKQAEATGYSRPGGYADYLVAPAAYCGRLPSDCDMAAMAPILCAGVTTYRGLKRTGARPGQWVVVLGVGGLGHIAIQYARAMGLRVAAIDIADDKLAHARELGAELVVDGRDASPASAVQTVIGGAHAAIVTAVAPAAFEEAIKTLRPGGSVAFIGLPGGDKDLIRLSIAQLVNGELNIKGSNVGTRIDLDEAIGFAARGLVTSTVEKQPLEQVNDVLERMRRGQITGRVVLDLTARGSR
jgi:alcohol dehydrogenase, propanol-preferring